MTQAHKITQEDITTGKPLEWDLYDNIGRLLLRKGNIINNEAKLEKLAQRGLFRQDQEKTDGSPAAEQPSLTAFEKIQSIKNRLGDLFDKIQCQQCPNLQEEVYEIAEDIQGLCIKAADLAIAALHLNHEGCYTVYHPAYTAILTEIICRRMGFSNEDCISIISSALTANVAMNALQKTMHQQTEELSDEQVETITKHPVRSVELLLEASVSDELWYQTVLFHHEKIDGSGYPTGLTGDAIPMSARIISIADAYAAMVSPQGYRHEFLAKEALREIFMKRGGEIDPELAQIFIDELGVYPPGCWVTFANGETGIVTHRAKHNNCQRVSSLIDANGKPFSTPCSHNSCDDGYAIKDIVRRRPDISIDFQAIWPAQDKQP